MISTKRSDDVTLFEGENEALVKEHGEETLQLVLAAMDAGLWEFTTPTPADDEGRIDWKVKRWMTMKDGKPACFLVAYKELNAHFEVVGPEIQLSPLTVEARSTTPTPADIPAGSDNAAPRPLPAEAVRSPVNEVAAPPASADTAAAKAPKIPIPARK